MLYFAEKSPISSSEPLTSCPGFSCLTELGKCLPLEKRCDRIVDCLDAEDEIGCVSQTGYWQSRDNSNNEFLESIFDNKSADDASNDTERNRKKLASFSTIFTSSFNKIIISCEKYIHVYI